jgi:hypothetical protein
MALILSSLISGGYLNQMLGKNNIIHKTTSLVLAITVWCVYSMVALAAPKDIKGEITVSGSVTVNGQSAVSNSTIDSGSTIVTGANSTAIISLGKAGRVELLANSNLTLKFTESSITAILNGSDGKARISDNAGIATTVTTKDGVSIADAGQANSFAVEVECSHTHLDTLSGLVTLRSGANDKQVAAGTDATAGNLTQQGCKPCFRQKGPVGVYPISGIGSGALAAILIGVGAGAGLAIFLTKRESISNIGGTVNVVSAIR